MSFRGLVTIEEINFNKDNIKRNSNVLTCCDHWWRCSEKLMIQLTITKNGSFKLHNFKQQLRALKEK
jgi:hypothetical protein